MPRSSELKTNFTAGELSDNVDARIDFARYFNGSLKLENFVIRPQGSIFRRKGTRYLSPTKDSTKLSRLLEFQFSVLQTYALEYGENYIRFFSNESRVLENAKSISNATQTDPVVITATAHGYSNNDIVVIEDVEGMIEINNKEYIIGNVTANTYELVGIDGTGFTSYSANGTSKKVHEITSPYLESQLFDIRSVQDSDITYNIHPLHPIQKLTRLAFNQFTLSQIDLIKGPYVEQNIVSTDLVTLTGGAPWTEGSTLTLTASGGHTPFTSNHVGGLWRIKEGTDIAHLKITGFTSSTVVTVIAQNDIPVSLQGAAKSTWSEGEFSNARSYPSAVAFHEQRLVLAGSINAPQRIWFSKSNADYENFEEGTNADDAFTVKIASQRGDPIRWLFSDNVLFVGSADGVFRVVSSRNGSALSATDIDIKKNISHGSDLIQPESVDDTPLYIQRGGQKVRSVNFSVSQDKYKASDITIDSDQITGDGLVEINSQENPISTLWGIRSDGELSLLTLEQDQEVIAWGRYTTQGKFESSAIISDASGNDVIYSISNRTINGVTKRFIETHKPNFLNDNVNGFYVDSGLTYNGTQNTTLTLSSASGSFGITTEDGLFFISTEIGEVLITEEEPTSIVSDIGIFVASDVGKEIHELGGGLGRGLITVVTDDKNITIEVLEEFSSATLLPGTWAIAVKTVTGLDHLIGETVSINSDGATEVNQVVNSSGEVSIPFAGSIIHVGLPYTSLQRNMPIEASGLSKILGSSQGKVKRIDSIIIRFKETRGGQVLFNDETVDIVSRSVDNAMNRGLELFNGNRDLTIATGWDTEGIISIQQQEPQPMTIKSITYKVTVNDK